MINNRRLTDRLPHQDNARITKLEEAIYGDFLPQVRDMCSVQHEILSELSEQRGRLIIQQQIIDDLNKKAIVLDSLKPESVKTINQLVAMGFTMKWLIVGVVSIMASVGAFVAGIDTLYKWSKLLGWTK